MPFMFIFTIISGIANLVLFIILCYYYFDGDTSTYVDFLNCPGVNEKKFYDKFGNVEDFKSAFIPFFVLNIIYIALSFVNSCTSKKQNEH